MPHLGLSTQHSLIVNTPQLMRTQHPLACVLYRGWLGAFISLSSRWDMCLSSKSLHASWGCRSLATDLEELDMLLSPWISVPRLIWAKARAILTLDVLCTGSFFWKGKFWQESDICFSDMLLAFTFSRNWVYNNTVHYTVNLLSPTNTPSTIYWYI